MLSFLQKKCKGTNFARCLYLIHIRLLRANQVLDIEFYILLTSRLAHKSLHHELQVRHNHNASQRQSLVAKSNFLGLHNNSRNKYKFQTRLIKSAFFIIKRQKLYLLSFI